MKRLTRVFARFAENAMFEHIVHAVYLRLQQLQIGTGFTDEMLQHLTNTLKPAIIDGPKVMAAHTLLYGYFCMLSND